MKEKIMPAFVLCLICTIVCGLLVGAYKLTYVDNTGVMTDDLKEGCSDIFGEDEYSILKDEQGEVITDDNLIAIIRNTAKDKVIFEVKVDGFNKGGLHLLVGINKDGSVEGVYCLSISETPGLGSKVGKSSYLEKYKGVTDEASVDAVDNVQSATYSSKGVKSAAKTALEMYDKYKEAILGE